MDEYEEYIAKREAKKKTPIKIEFNYHARGFCCPTCLTGCESKNHICKYCGQYLLDFCGFDENMEVLNG